MANYVSLRGWLNCSYDEVEKIKVIVERYRKQSKYNKLMNDDIKNLYNNGWQFLVEVINWNAYIFYGADLKFYCLPFIKEQVIDICKLNNDIQGLFFIDDEENLNLYWKINNGKLLERKIPIELL